MVRKYREPLLGFLHGILKRKDETLWIPQP
jgi:hypothetical protein